MAGELQYKLYYPSQIMMIKYSLKELYTSIPTQNKRFPRLNYFARC